jgi:hypothetical protein
MKNLLALSALLITFGLITGATPAQAQYSGVYGQPQGWHGVLSADDQGHFDKYYSKWVEATRKNDQDDISGNARHMQDIMARYNIPQNVPFDQIASNSGAYPNGPYQSAYPSGAYPNGPYQSAYPAYGQTRLSPDDQRQFDKDYSKWIDATRKNDQDDISENARKMQDIMARYNISPNVPFAQVATGGNAGGYPNTAYGYPYGQQQRLSAEDQHNFDKDYKKWVDARRKNDRDDIDKNARRMQDIMARYNIPANVPFDRIASLDAPSR